MVVEKGLLGSLRAGSRSFYGAMPPQGASLGDVGVAAVLNHVLMKLNTADKAPDWRPFTAEEVAAVKKRYAGITATTVLRRSI